MPDRQRHAAEVLAAVDSPLHDARILAVQCANGHHVAGVYRTSEGPVLQVALSRHSHGRRDRIDTAHKGTQSARRWTDFMATGTLADDEVPAWCDCGPWTLSRSEMDTWISDGERRVVLHSKA